MKYKIALVCAWTMMLLVLAACSRDPAPPQGGSVSAPPAAVSQQSEDDGGDIDGLPGESGGSGGSSSGSGSAALDEEHQFMLSLPFVNEMTVLDTWASPASGGSPLAVHIVRSIGDETIPLYRQYAVVVNPVTREQTLHSLTDAYVRDAYNVDSVARAYGFIDDNRLLYVAAVGDDPVGGAFTYRVATLDIRTGNVTTVVQELPDAPMDEFFVPGWLAADGKELVLNTHQSGLMWRIDIKRQTAALANNRYPHEWPFFLTVPSPDGERLWYMDINSASYKLYTLDDKQLAELPFVEGYDQYPPFTWSAGGRYATFAYTDTRDNRHVISQHEIYEAATQHIGIYDREGKLVRTVSANSANDEYVEPVGWLPGDDQLLLRHYKLEHNGGAGAPVKTGFRFELLSAADGSAIALEQVDTPEALASPQAVYDKRVRALSWIDMRDRTIWHSGVTSVVLLSKPDADNVRWVEHTFAAGGDFSTVRAYNAAASAWSTLRLDQLIDSWPVLIGDSWIAGNDLYYVAVQRNSED